MEGSMKDVQWVDGVGLFLIGTHGQILHFDGSTWTLEQQLEQGNFSTNILTTIHAVDADHIYAGHNSGTVYQRNPGGTWTDLELNEGGFFGSGQILDIRGQSPDDLYFFTDRTIRHFTGLAPTQNTEYGRSVRGSWKAADSAGDQLFIVDNQGGVYQFDSSTSSLSPLAVSVGDYFNGRLNGATAFGSDGLLLFGDGMHYQDPAMALATSNGSSINRFPVDQMPEGASHSANMIAAATRSDGEITVVFDDFQTGRSGIYSKEADGWFRRQADYFAGNGMQLNYSSSNLLYMCDSQRVAYWPNPTSGAVEILRLSLEEAAEERFTALWSPDDNRVFVGGHDGQIRRWDGTNWQPKTTLPDVEIGALTGDNDHVYAIAFDDGSFGDTGHLWHRSPAGTWTEIPLIPDLAVKPLGFAKSRDEIYFAYATPTNFIGGGRTFITKLQGASAVPEVTGLSSQYDAITSNAAGDIFLLNASGHFLTNREAPSTFASGIVPHQEDTWHGLESAGIQITPSSSLDGHSYFVGWRSPGLVSPELIPAHFQPGQEHWVLNHDNVITEENSPEFRFRFAYEPTLLPPSFDPSHATMLRLDGSVWEPVPAIVNEAEGYIETSTPTATSTWVIAIDQRDPITPSSLSIAAAGTDSITLSWPADVSQTLYSSINLEPGSWVAVPETPTILGDLKTLTISRADHRLFFRLGD